MSTIPFSSYKSGYVSLVGAGPGDPDLLTIKALRCITHCDVVVYDRLVSTEITQLIPDGIERIYVGKAKGKHSVPQSETNQLLIELARQGKHVCRLKGGDAFVFGRGGEELLQLHQAGIYADVVPGITAASGCTTYAGIPLTHRGLSQGATFVTAHAEKELSINWQALASLNHTLVFYMGLSKVGVISQSLCQHGLSRQTPVAIIENGCTPKQRVFIAGLDTIEKTIQGQGVKSPALIVVEVVTLAAELNWFIAQAQSQLEKLSA